MKIVRHFTHLPAELRGAVIALGNFDGVHRGHQAVIARAAALADELSSPLAVAAFEPHPRELFDPGGPSFRLTSFHSKARLIERLGVDIFYVLPFDQAMAGRSAPDFVLGVLVRGLGVRHLVVGYDFAFGRGRSGNTAVLNWMGLMESFGVTTVEPVVRPGDAGAHGEVFSSTRIREHLRAGAPRQAADLLGHWWSIEGHVLKGDQRGRTIGFPTLNVDMGSYLEPRHGVYAVWVEVQEPSASGDQGPPPVTVYSGVANVGRRPTFAREGVVLEAHMFDYSGNLYGRQVRVSFVEFLREERKFDGIEALKDQISRDSLKAREILAVPAAQLDVFATGLDAIAGAALKTP